MPSLLHCLPLCLVLVASTVATGQQCKPMQVKKEHLNKRLTAHLLKAATIPSYGTCAYHCLVSTDCQSINYCLGPSLCELNTEDSLTFPAHLVQANNCVFTDKGDLPKSMAGGCEVNPCPASHQCIPGLQQECQKLCPSLPQVANAVVSVESLDEGSQGVYECGTGHRPVSTSPGVLVMTTTCTSTLTWSPTNFMCVAICPSLPQVANAVVSVESLDEGSQGVYECGTGHRPVSTSPGVLVMTTTCTATLTWSPTNFMCVAMTNTITEPHGGGVGHGSQTPSSKSCKQIKAASPSALSGEYTVFPGAATEPLAVFCDFDDPVNGYTYLPKSSIYKLQGLEDITAQTDHVMFQILYDNDEQYAVKMAQHSSFTQYPLSFQLSKYDGYSDPRLGSETPYIYVGFLNETVASIESSTQGYTANGTDKEYVSCNTDAYNYFSFIANPIDQPAYSIHECRSTYCEDAFQRGWIYESHLVLPTRHLPAADDDDYFYFFELRFGGCGGRLTSRHIAAVGLAAGFPFDYGE